MRIPLLQLKPRPRRQWPLVLLSVLLTSSIGAQPPHSLATAIRNDRSLRQVKSMAMDLVRAGFTAGNSYGEVWIRDFNTFIELSCRVLPRDSIKQQLRIFFLMQGDDGNIIDGYIPKSKSTVGYEYIYSEHAPQYAGHKNTVETDQESSLVQAVYKYIRETGDTSFLTEVIVGKTVQERMADALRFLLQHRFSKQFGLLFGATTVDWGDVQPEHSWGVVLDSNSHLAIDIYDNAMFTIALDNYLSMCPGDRSWIPVQESFRKNIRKYLWDKKRRKFRPHLYLSGSPFPASFDEEAISYHGGTAVAIEAGLLTRKEIQQANQLMLRNVRNSGAMSIGLTIYPVYPEGFFKNRGMVPYGYQNGGDWTWFGARMIKELADNGFLQEAYTEIKPFIDRVIKNNGFYEWYSVDGKPAGSGNFRGAAGVLYSAIESLEQAAVREEK